MITINSARKEIINVIGNQSYQKGQKYKKIIYCVEQKVDEGYLLYNVLTRELILVSNKEIAALTSNSIDYLFAQRLCEKWFIIPDNIDDRTIQHIIRQKITPEERLWGSKIELFTIMPTTDCNARCPYCYEAGYARMSMGETIARDVAEYIRKNGADSINLKWFGGEPLCNAEAINEICKYLQVHGVNYTSSMVTNGYLFHEHAIKEIKNLWKLGWVQITLDGVDEAYNKTKRFIYPECAAKNPFKQVMNNIEYLLDMGTKVQVRINIGKDNVEHIEELINRLSSRFKEYQNFQAYIHPLFDGMGTPPLVLTGMEHKQLYDDYIRLQKSIHDIGLYPPKKSMHGIRSHHCMADNCRCVVITPTGDLTVCEHHCEDEIIGSIYSNQFNKDILVSFRERAPEIEECKTCFFYPCCLLLKKCPTDTICTQENRNYQEYETRQMMLDVYKQYKDRMKNDEKGAANSRRRSWIQGE